MISQILQSKKYIIAICGNKRSGKDTLAAKITSNKIDYSNVYKQHGVDTNFDDIVNDIWKRRSTRFAFADLAKEEFVEKFESMPSDKEEMRKQLHSFTKEQKSLDELYYCRPLEHLYNKIPDNSAIIITDLRLPIEIEYLKQFPVIYVRVINLFEPYVEPTEYERRLDGFRTHYINFRTF